MLLLSSSKGLRNHLSAATESTTTQPPVTESTAAQPAAADSHNTGPASKSVLERPLCATATEPAAAKSTSTQSTTSQPAATATATAAAAAAAAATTAAATTAAAEPLRVHFRSRGILLCAVLIENVNPVN